MKPAPPVTSSFFMDDSSVRPAISNSSGKPLFPYYTKKKRINQEFLLKPKSKRNKMLTNSYYRRC